MIEYLTDSPAYRALQHYEQIRSVHLRRPTLLKTLPVASAIPSTPLACISIIPSIVSQRKPLNCYLPWRQNAASERDAMFRGR